MVLFVQFLTVSFPILIQTRIWRIVFEKYVLTASTRLVVK